MNILYDYIANLLSPKVGLTATDLLEFLETPSIERGDVSLPCFRLSKNMHLPPAVIAEQLATELNDKNIVKIEAVGGFLNFTFDPKFVAEQLMTNLHIEQEQISSTSGMQGKTVLIEHTSINPNASPHIGRARNALIADSLVRIFRFLGWRTDTHYFVNDVGKQIAMLVYATRDRTNVTFDDLLQIYIDINEKAKNDPQIEQEVFAYLRKFENGDAQVIAEFDRIVSTCIRGQTAIFSELGISWDHFDYESRYIHQHITDQVLAELKKSPKLFEDEHGRLVLDQHGEKIGIEDPMLVVTRQDKTSLYALRDICYSLNKARSGADRNLLVLGEDQKVYFQQISAAMRLLGAQPAEVVHYSFVLLPDGKMSTRQGNVVLLSDFMREITNKANDVIREKRGISDVSKAKIVGYGALKYSILKSSPEKNVLFDWENALNFSGDSSLYAQYNYARIQSILAKASCDFSSPAYARLISDSELALIKQLYNFENTLYLAYRNLNPSVLTNYLFNLTSKFSQFYTAENILNLDDQELKIARLALISKTATVIKNSLALLGIEVTNQL